MPRRRCWPASRPRPATRPGRATLRRLAADAAGELRAIVVGLRPTDLAAGLEPALRRQVELLDRVHQPAVRYLGEPVPRLAASRESAVYRVAQEAVHNALRHAEPTAVEVRLSRHGPSVVLEVSDDGRGFEPEAVSAAATSRRLGLASMRERARAVGGRLTVTSRPGGGTTVRLEVPVRG